MTTAELEECIVLYGREIYSFCRQLTGSSLEADELYQDTFLKAMEKLSGIQADANPKAWLLSVAIRLWKNKKRKFAWRNRIAPLENLTEEKRDALQEEKGSPETVILQNERELAVRRAVNLLEEKYRIPVYLYYMEELSLREIADIIKIPEGTVKSRLYHARKRLWTQFKEEGTFQERSI